MKNFRTHASLLVGALVLAGCGDDGVTTTDDVNTSTTTTSTTTGPQVTTGEPTTTTGTPTTSTTDATSTTATTNDDTTTTDTTTDASTGLHPSTTIASTEPAASCDDGVLNQDETDLDCGGATCSPCADGLACTQDSDCAVENCAGGVCAAPSCEDLDKNADETDVDCGGATCPACGDSLGCAEPTDCQSGVCTDGTCAAATCGDGVLNQDESDTDCGGATCNGCLGDMLCVEDSDCLSGTCDAGICDAPLCLLDSDCAALDSECTTGVCQMPGFTCVAEPINDGNPCEDNTVCFDNSVCNAGTCGGGDPLDCSGSADACHTASCDPVEGCLSTELADGTDCDDGEACTNLEVCQAGVCGSSLDDIFTEDFSDNSAGWTVGTQWAIGSAAASAGCSGGQDPGADHTATADNGVAGVVLGGCIPSTAVHDYYCLESPTIDLSGAVPEVHLSYWRYLNSDYTPYMKNKFEVFNGTDWVLLWETLGSPGTYDSEWKFFSYNVSTHKNANFRARWCFNVGSTGVYLVGSWNLDDVTVGPAACVP